MDAAERKRAYDKARYAAIKADPKRMADLRARKRIAKRRKRATDPAFVERSREAQRRHRAANPQKHKQYRDTFLAKKGNTYAEWRRKLRAANPLGYQESYRRSNARRICAVRAAFRRGDITLDEFNRRISEFIARTNEIAQSGGLPRLRCDLQLREEHREANATQAGCPKSTKIALPKDEK